MEADPDRLGQIVANLIENASSFAQRRIDIGTTHAGGRPVVWVADDGPGIPSDQLARVFERHFVSDRVSGRRVGSGLGLAIVSELAAAMGATVRAESPLPSGRGTRMVVALRSDSPGSAPPGLSGRDPAALARPVALPQPVPSALVDRRVPSLPEPAPAPVGSRPKPDATSPLPDNGVAVSRKSAPE